MAPAGSAVVALVGRDGRESPAAVGRFVAELKAATR